MAELRRRYRPSLFQHIGTFSSLKGKVQKLKACFTLAICVILDWQHLCLTYLLSRATGVSSIAAVYILRSTLLLVQARMMMILQGISEILLPVPTVLFTSAEKIMFSLCLFVC